MNFAAAAIGVAFWLFVASAAVAGIIADYRKRQLALEPLRIAIERGQQLQPEVLSQLLRSSTPASPVDPVQLQVASIIVVSSAFGVAALAWFVAQIAPVALYPILGASCLTLCVGIGLNIAARVLARARAAASAQDPHA